MAHASQEKNPAGLLYHVAPEPNAKLIERKGFDSGFRCSESGVAACVAERILAGEDEEEVWEEIDAGDVGEEMRAREIMNEILDRNMPPGKNLPSHSGGSVFFWSDPRTSRYRRSLVETPYHPMRTVVVDAEKIPCRCYQADVRKTDELFEEIYRDWENAEYCTGAIDPPDEWWKEEGGEEWCGYLHRLARDYYAEMQPWDGKPKPDEEILCPCDIPPDAIRAIR